MSVPEKKKGGGMQNRHPPASHTGAHVAHKKPRPLPSRAVVKRNLGNATKIRTHKRVQVQGWSPLLSNP